MSTRIRSTHYRRGTVLWHGTNAKSGFRMPNGPAWFSDSHDVARWFAGWRIDSVRDANREVPRIQKYVVNVPFSLPTYDGRAAKAHEIEFMDWVARLAKRGVELNDPYESAELLCRAGFVGWRIAMNYETGDDLMICAPDRYLRRVPARGSWRSLRPE
jgi:hypothetical protein